MKRTVFNKGEYVSPESNILDVCFEGALCASTEKEKSATLEGYGIEDSFSGWGY